MTTAQKKKISRIAQAFGKIVLPQKSTPPSEISTLTPTATPPTEKLSCLKLRQQLQRRLLREDRQVLPSLHKNTKHGKNITKLTLVLLVKISASFNSCISLLFFIC